MPDRIEAGAPNPEYERKRRITTPFSPACELATRMCEPLRRQKKENFRIYNGQAEVGSFEFVQQIIQS